MMMMSRFSVEKATFQTSLLSIFFFVLCVWFFFVLFFYQTNLIICLSLFFQHGNVFPSDRFMDRTGPSQCSPI